MLPLAGQRLLQPTRIFFAGGPSGNMASSNTGSLGGDALDVKSVPYRRERMRRELQDAEYDDTVEIIDASDDPVGVANLYGDFTQLDFLGAVVAGAGFVENVAESFIHGRQRHDDEGANIDGIFSFG